MAKLGKAAMRLAKAISDAEVVVDGDAILINRRRKALLAEISGCLKKPVTGPPQFPEYTKYPVKTDVVGNIHTLCYRAGLLGPHLKVVEQVSQID